MGKERVDGKREEEGIWIGLMWRIGGWKALYGVDVYAEACCFEVGGVGLGWRGYGIGIGKERVWMGKETLC